MDQYDISITCQIPALNALYMKHFGYISDGTFVDVGANDGYSYSNTWGLAKAGWHGVLYEPMPQSYGICVSMYSGMGNIKVYECAVSNINGMTNLYGNLNPTIDMESAKLSPFDEKYDLASYIPVMAVTLDSHLPVAGVKPRFEVISIDVEGAELQVLQGFDIDYWMPKMVIVETHELCKDKKRALHAPQILAWFASKPYSKVYSDEINTIFVRN